jgi:LysM repeat protein
MTVYVIQAGDTLWKVAKRYNTSIDEILAINDIENPDMVYPGQKLLILKKIAGETA